MPSNHLRSLQDLDMTLSPVQESQAGNWGSPENKDCNVPGFILRPPVKQTLVGIGKEMPDPRSPIPSR